MAFCVAWVTTSVGVVRGHRAHGSNTDGTVSTRRLQHLPHELGRSRRGRALVSADGTSRDDPRLLGLRSFKRALARSLPRLRRLEHARGAACAGAGAGGRRARGARGGGGGGGAGAPGAW